MSLSWIANRSLKFSPRVRLVDDDAAAALRHKLESLEWKPSNGFLRDEIVTRPQAPADRPRSAA